MTVNSRKIEFALAVLHYVKKKNKKVLQPTHEFEHSTHRFFDGVSGIVQPTTLLSAHAQNMKSCPLIDLCVWCQQDVLYQFCIAKLVDVLIS